MIDVQRLFDEAMSHPAVSKLLNDIDSRTDLTLQPSSDEYWSSDTADGRTTIEIASTDYPSEALYHELLHADLKIGGYVQYLTTTTVTMAGAKLPGLLGALDNELQHHRMFVRFVDAGLKPENFYADADEETYDSLRPRIEAITTDSDPSEALLIFLSLIAPGGAGSEAVRDELRSLLMEQCGPGLNAKLEVVEQAFANWADSADTDPLATILVVLRALGQYDGTWIGTSPSEFPDQGAFVGRIFTVKEALDFHGSLPDGGSNEPN